MLWLRARLSSRWRIQRFSSAACRLRGIEDEGDWFYSSEWWGTESDGHTVFQSNSVKGNGDVSVVAYPSSRPARESRSLPLETLQPASREAVDFASQECKCGSSFLRGSLSNVHLSVAEATLSDGCCSLLST